MHHNSKFIVLPAEVLTDISSHTTSRLLSMPFGNMRKPGVGKMREPEVGKMRKPEVGKMRKPEVGNMRFPDAFRSCRKRPEVWNGLP